MRGKSVDWRAGLVALAIATLSCGCGGAGGDGSPGPRPSKVVVVSGAIGGFSSIYLNGIRYDTAGSEVEVDGAPAKRSDLLVGEVVVLKGTAGKDSARAEFIRLDHDVAGPVAGLATGSRRFVVLGQTIVVSSETSFDRNFDPPSLLGVQVGDAVEVSGLVGASGQIEATRVNLRQGAPPLRVAGRVAALDAAGRRFMINALVVDYSTASVNGFPAGTPSEGDRVRVEASRVAADGTLPATLVELLSDPRLVPPAESTVHLDGLVTRFASATDFDLGTWKVTTGTATVFEFGTAADLGPDVRAEVDGTVGADGLVGATKVRIRPANTVRIVSDVTAIDLDRRRLTALGVDVATGGSTRFEDRTETGLRTLRLGDLHTGEWITVRGYEDPAGSGRVTATRLERVTKQAAHQLRGPFRTPDSPEFHVLEVRAATTAATLFLREGSGQVGTAEFFAQPPETIVEVSGAYDGASLTATSAIIKTLDD